MNSTRRGREKDKVVQKRRALVMYCGQEPTQSQLELRNYNKLRADLIVIDESNSFSEKERSDRRYLTIVCSRVSDYKRFASISDKLPVMKGRRSKHSNMSSVEIERIIDDISSFTESEFAIVEQHRYIDYGSLDSPESKVEFYIDVLANAIYRSVSLDPNRSMIIIIDNPPLRMYDQLWILGETLFKEYPNVMWFETRQSAGTKVLQTHDVVTGAISDHIENKPDRGSAYEKLKRYVRR